MLTFHDAILSNLTRESASGIGHVEMLSLGTTAPVRRGDDALLARVVSCRASYVEARADIGLANKGRIRDGLGQPRPFHRPGRTAAEDRAACRRHAMRVLNRARANLRRAEAALAAFEAPVVFAIAA